MAVKALWQCDRDGKMFTNKKDADAHDQMLELAEAISNAIEENIPGIDSDKLDDIGRLVARNKDIFAKAFKGKASELTKLDFAEPTTDANTATNEDAQNKVTKLTKAS